MSTSTDDAKTTAYVDRRSTCTSRKLRAFVRRSAISKTELDQFMQKHGYAPDGRTERFDGRRDDGWIEFERTLEDARTDNSVLHAACIFACDMENQFPRIEVQVL